MFWIRAQLAFYVKLTAKEEKGTARKLKNDIQCGQKATPSLHLNKHGRKPAPK